MESGFQNEVLHGQHRKAGELTRWFVLSAGAILLTTGVAKIISAAGNAPILSFADPVFGVPWNYLLLSVGLIELVIAVLCLTSTSQDLPLGFVAAISVNFSGLSCGALA